MGSRTSHKVLTTTHTMVQVKDPTPQPRRAEIQLEEFHSKLSHLREQWEQESSPASEAKVDLLDEDTFTSELQEIKRYQLDSDHVNDYIRGTLSPDRFDPGLLYVCYDFDSEDVSKEEAFSHFNSVSITLAQNCQRQVLAQDITLYRGASGRLIDGKKVGDVFQYESFTSVSTDQTVAEVFYAGVMYEIAAPKGLPHIEVTNVNRIPGKLPTGEAEGELILLPMTYEIVEMRDGLNSVGKKINIVKVKPLISE